MIPKAVIFDLGKVLVDFDYSIAGRRIAARSRMTPQQVQEFIDHSPLLFRLERGAITSRDFYQEVCAVTGFAGAYEEFAGFFADIFTPMKPMVELHAALRARGVPTFIFSNTNDLAAGHIRRRFPFFSRFDGYILSYEHGAMKPQPKLYEVVERASGLRATELIYLDDRPENIEAGKARGWQVILQESPEKSIAAIKQAGLLD